MGKCSNMHTYYSSSLLFIISLLTIAFVSIKLSDAYRLLHRDQLLGRGQLNRSERIRQMLYRDAERILITRSRRRRMSSSSSSSAAVSPIFSGSDNGTGEYFAELWIGTPPKKFLLAVDTGSDLTWVYCKYKGSRSSPPSDFFYADRSSSFQTIPCSSDYCRNDLHALFSVPCKSETHQNCVYRYGYHGSEAMTYGIFAKESVRFDLTNGKQTLLKKTLIGCTTSSSPSLDHEILGASGVMGLSNSPFSLPMQASKLFGETFSLCLVEILSHRNKSSKLFFGQPQVYPKSLDRTRMQTTKLELEASFPFYGVHVQNISIVDNCTKAAGPPLKIPDSTWRFGKWGGGGTVLDSGMTLTYLAHSAYVPVMDALRKPLKHATLARVPDGSPFEYCYTSKSVKRKLAVAMEVGFEGGAKLRVPASGYLVRAPAGGDDGDELTCLGIVDEGEGPDVQSTIGNLWQQKILWEFDIRNRKLKFAKSDCVY